MARKLARRPTQCNRKSSSEDAELSAFLDQLDDRIEEEVKRADGLLEKPKISDLTRLAPSSYITPPDGGPGD